LILETYGNFARKNKTLALASRKHAQMLAAGLLRQSHIYITVDELFRFHNE